MFVYRLFLFFFLASQLMSCFSFHFVSWLCNFQQQPSVFFFLWLSFSVVHFIPLSSFQRSVQGKIVSPHSFFDPGSTISPKLIWPSLMTRPSHMTEALWSSVYFKNMFDQKITKKYISSWDCLAPTSPTYYSWSWTPHLSPDICLYLTILKK